MVFQIYALPGFLGLPSDWEAVGQGLPWIALKNEEISPPHEGLEKWGQAFNRWIEKQGNKKRILLGYSQGGRLAMQALVDAPELWSGAIIVSANPGIASSAEREPRTEIDRKWAERFLNDPWEKVIADWNHQPVFQGEKASFQRREADFDRRLLADALVGWSVGKQGDLKESVAKLPFPILWIAGEKDRKYAAIAEGMVSLNEGFTYWIAPGAGHRVPWEKRGLFLDRVNSWIKQCF